MPRFIAILLTVLPMLYAPGDALCGNAGTSRYNISHVRSNGSRLSRISDRDENPVKAYDYHLFSPEDYIHGYIRETTFLQAAGKDSMSAVQLFDCYGEQYATIAEDK